MKLSLKINLLFTTIVTGILLVMAMLVYIFTSNSVQDDFRTRIKTRAARTAYLFQIFKEDTTNLLKSLDATSPAALVNKNINIYNEQRELLYEFHDASTSRLMTDTSWFDKVTDKEYAYFTRDGKDICLYNDHVAGPTRYIVMVGAENISGKEYISDLKSMFLIYLPLAILVTIVAGYVFSKSLLKPVKETIHDVQLITSQNMSHRLFVGDKKDELSQLNATFNDLLNRLEESFAIQRRFISNASHELSTPLTSVSSQIEVALLHDRESFEYRRVLGSVLEDVKELHQLSKTLLDIAMAGTHGTIALDTIRIDEVMMKAHADVLKQNHTFNVTLDFADLPEDEQECLVFGNPHLLQSAVKNIMENGCKYSPDRTVAAEILFKGDKVELTFRNSGDIIPDDEINRLFEPFYRGNNAEGKPGVGLGLTLTKRIIGLHKGTLEIASDQAGTLFTIILPTLKG